MKPSPISLLTPGFFAAAILSFSPLTSDLHAQSAWINPAGGEISDSGNWSPTVPSTTQDGVFLLNSAYTVDVSDDFAGRNLTVGSGTVTVNIADNTTLSLLASSTTTGVYLVAGGASIITGSGTLLTTGAFGSFSSATLLSTHLISTGVGVDMGGSLTINNSTVQAGYLAIGTGRMDQVSGTVQTGEFMVATGSGATGRYDFSGGQILVTGTSLDGSGGSFRVGDFGGSGTFNQTGGLVQLTTTSTAGNSLNIGNQGGTGVYNISSGTLGFAGAGFITLGRTGTNASGVDYPAGSGVLNISGSSLVDISGSGTTAAFIIGDNTSSANNGSGTVNQTSGTLSFHDGANFFLSGFAPTNSGTNTYNLLGGVLAIGGDSLRGAYNSSSPYAFNLGGGTIRVTGSNLVTSVNANLVSGASSKIDTNGLNATWNGSFSGSNSQLVKVGSGTLTMTSNNKIDSFFTDIGTLAQTSGTISSYEVGVGSGTTAGSGPNVGVYNMSGGTLLLVSGTPPPLVGGSASVLRVGDFGGSGTFNQTGGQVTVNGSLNIGNQGGSGIYNLTSGTLTLLSGNSVLGRSVAPHPVSDGTLNIGGGLMQLKSGAALILGNNTPGVAGSGLITQTSGTLQVDNDSGLYLAGSGSGTYNLNGGVLEVGGNSLQARYNSTTSPYAFNLGGGTIRVTGTDLVTSVDANLVSTTSSTINTNGLNATWNGSFSGSNSQLVKVGSGTLTLTNNNKIDSFFTDIGTLAQTSGTISSYEVGVGSGTTAGSGPNVGVYTMSAGTLLIASGTPPPLVGGTASSFRVGDFGGSGTFNQTGGNVVVNGSLNVGNQGGHGTYLINGGTLNLASGLSTLGRTSGSSASSGGSTGELDISGNAVVNLSGTAHLTASNWYPASGITQGNGVINQTGGLLHVDNTAMLTLTGFGTGTYNLNGGTLQIGGSSLEGVFGGENGTYNFNLGGGTIQVSGTDFVTNVNANLVAGTADIGPASKIDTNGFNATWSGLINGAQGGLIKTGSGTLTFNGSGTRSIGYFNADQGTTRQTAGLTTSTEFVVGSNYLAKNAAFNFEGGTLTVTGSTQATPGPSFRVGDFTGSGTFNQTGGLVAIVASSTAGASFHLGNEGGTGTYNISSGTLAFTGPGFVTMGRSTGTRAASSGSLNISGNALVDINGSGSNAQFIIGDNTTSTNNGYGVLNQTGGVLRIHNGANLYLSGFAPTISGTDTYNLLGGSLEIGGSSLVGSYNGSSPYAFNLGGGTIRVIDSDLTTSVNATLVSETSSTIDTNGFNAIWNGSITGTNGQLVKIGTGDLGLTNSNQIASLYATGGSITQSSGTTTAYEIGLGYSVTGTTPNAATYNMTGGTLLIPSGPTPHIAGTTSFRIGDFGGSGTFNQTGGNVISNGALNIGNQGGHGVYRISSGTLTLASGLSTLGRTSGSSVNQGGSTGEFDISGSGVVNISGTSTLTLSNWYPSAILQQGSGTLNQTGGLLHVDNTASLILAGLGDGTYNLNSGTLEIGAGSLQGNFGGQSGAYHFNLGGGTIKVAGTDFVTTVNANLAAGTADLPVASKIDTNGLNATWSGLINGAQGGLIKTGSGTLTFNGSGTRSIGYFNTDQGMTHQTAGVTASTEFVVGSNYSAKNGAFTLDGGTINVSGSTQAASRSTFRVGDFGGTGAFTQNAGAVNADGSVVLGNRGGVGTYTLASGTFNIGEDAAPGTTGLIIGDSRASDATASSGTLDITGGLLHLFAGAALQIGGEVASDARSTGVVNQSGDSQVIVDKYIRLADSGTGTYNLNGGSLTIGGADGIRQGVGTAAFNLGGGTLNLSSNFSTSVNLTVSGTASTIANNAFTGTFSGALLGSGLVNKTGSGTMLVNSASSTASIAVHQGTLTGTGKTTGNVTVASGATLAGTINVGGITTIEQGATFGPGFSPAATYNDGDLVLAGTMYIELSGTAGGTGTFTAPTTGQYDQVLYGGAGGITIADDAVLQIASLASYLPEAGDTFSILLAANSITLDPSSITVEGVGALSDYIFYLTVDTTTWNGSGSYNTVELNVLAVPEPGTYALLAMAGGIFFLLHRRRKAQAGI